jgi:hypothetical protein
MRPIVLAIVFAGCGGGDDRPPSDPCFLGDCDGGPGHACETADDCADPEEPCVLWECADGACRPTGQVLDADGDGHGAAMCGGDDCDDANGEIPSGEGCNGVDDDCDGVVDEGLYGDGTDVVVADDLASNVTMAAVYGGSGYGVFWAREGTWQLDFQLLDADGNPVGATEPVPGTMDAGRPGHVGLVGIPGGFFATWGQGGDIGFSIITIEAGAGLPGVVDTADDSAEHVVAAYSGSVIAIGWIALESSRRWPTWAIVDPTGDVVAEPTRALSATTPPTVGMEWIGDRFAFLFEGVWGAIGDGGKVLFVDESGNQTGPGEYTDGAASSPVLAREGDVSSVLWNEREPVTLFYRATNETGAPLTNAVVLAEDSFAADVASAGNGTLAVWLTGWTLESGAFGELHAAAVGESIADVPEGDPANVEVLSPMDDTAGLAGAPSLVADEGGGFAVAFAAREGGIYFDRISCQ